MPNQYHQLVTHWTRGVPDGYGGAIFGTPEVYFAKWEDRQEQFMDSKAEISMSRAIIRVPADKVDNVSIDDYFYLGETDTSDPTTLDKAYPVRAIVKLPDLRYVRTENRIII